MDIHQYENCREKKLHADTRFPYNIYPCSIPMDFRLVPVHWHKEMELISIKRGEGMVTLDLKPFSVQEGDLVVVFPGKLHSIRQKPGFSMEYENIIFRLDMLMPALPDSCSLDFLLPLLSEDEPMAFIWRKGEGEYKMVEQQIEELDQISESRPYGYFLAVKGIFFRLLFLIFSRLQQNPEEEKPIGAQGRGKIKQILKEVELRYGENLSIQEMAKLCGYSPSHFMRFFRQYMGASFVEYVNEYRLTMASRQLACGEESISEIARNTGFDQISYFNRLFKRKFGMTPKQYRKEIRT